MTLDRIEQRYWAYWFGSVIRASGGQCTVFWLPSQRRCAVRSATRRAAKRLPPDAVEVGIYRLPVSQRVFADDLVELVSGLGATPADDAGCVGAGSHVSLATHTTGRD